MENQIEMLLRSTIENLQQIIDTNHVIGKPIVAADNALIVPISKVTFGFLTGGGEYSESNPKTKLDNLPHAGGSGGGVSIKPIGFLICYAGKQTMIKIDTEVEESKWTDIIKTAINLVKEK